LLSIESSSVILLRRTLSQGVTVFGGKVTSTLKIEETSVWKAILNIGEIKRDNIPCGLIAQFGVASNFQRQGVGKFMLSFIRGAAIDSDFGIKLLTLHVHKDNTAGRDFWKSIGFQIFKPASGDKFKFMVHDLFSGQLFT
jgi:GNAT superfamily N-acetyltransferase